jgi:thiamine biosynthesis lipoprotein
VTDSYVHTVAVVGTVVTVHIVGHGSTDDERRAREAAADRAIAWFEQVERVCSRFDPSSELSRLASRPGEAVAASAMLFQAVRFALAVAAETDGAFDPTVGATQQARGFDREHRSGRSSGVAVDAADDVSYRDVILGADRTITLARPLLLDLGAVAKGLAIDLAARELAPFENFAIDAGGDLYLAGHNAEGAPWSVGIRHPRDETAVIATLHASNAAVCTSGDYERRSESLAGEHHIVDPRTGASPRVAASATVQAPSAMVADALATAAFVLGPDDGIALLERQGVDGFIVTPSLERFQTAGLQLA